MIQASYRVDEEGMGILRVLFPQFLIVREPLPPFPSSENLIIISETSSDPYPGSTVIQITKRAKLRLDTKDGMLEYLQDLGVKISDRQKEVLLFLEDEEFWSKAKQALVLRSIHGVNEEEGSSVFELFMNLFEGIEKVYPIYRKLASPHRVVFSALLTMMLKTKDAEDAIGISPGYKRVLLKNRPYTSLYKRKVVDYLLTPMAETDFLTFLAELSHVS